MRSTTSLTCNPKHHPGPQTSSSGSSSISASPEETLQLLDAEIADAATRALFVVQTVDDLAALRSLGFTVVLAAELLDLPKNSSHRESAYLCRGAIDPEGRLGELFDEVLYLEKNPALALGYATTIGRQWTEDEKPGLRQTWLELCIKATPSIPTAAGSSIKERRPFPTDSLPPSCRSMVEESARSQDVETAFLGVPLLAILAGCIGATRRIEAKKDWSEPSIIWTALIAPSGSGKTPGLRRLLRPVQEHDNRLSMMTRQEMHAYRTRAATEHQTDPARTPPPRRASLVDDVTMEALAALLQDNPRGLMLARDELSGWIKSFDKYRAGDDTERWLQLYGAAPIKVDRKGSEPIAVRHPAVSITGTIQPYVAQKVFGTEQARRSGLAPRLLVCRPKLRVPTWSAASTSESSTSNYEQVTANLLSIPCDPSNPNGKQLPLTRNASEAFVDYYKDMAQRWHSAQVDGDEDSAAVLAKLRGYALRLALVMALAEAAESREAASLREIDVTAMERGIRLAQWFQVEASEVYREWDDCSPTRIEQLCARTMALLGDSELSKTELLNAFHRNVSAEVLNSVLEKLEAEGRVQMRRISQAGRGRPRVVYQRTEAICSSPPHANA